jgi:hypothetical protein
MIVTEPTTPLIFHAQPGGTFSFMGCLCITATFSENSENLEFIVCFGLYGNILLRIY